MLIFAPQPGPFDKVATDDASTAGEARREDSGAKPLRRVLAALFPWVGRSKPAELPPRDMTGNALQVHAGPLGHRDSAVRLNTALRKWSVDSEQQLSLMKRSAAAIAPPGETSETKTRTTVQEPSGRPMKDPPPPAEEKPVDDKVEEEMNEGEDRGTEQEAYGSTNASPLPDYYEILQISRKAEMETIHRVYRIMALRLHPDNAKTGSLERFLLLKQAYQVLSDPARRAEYDAAHVTVETQPLPVFESKDFVYGIDGERNRRLGVLSLLYHKRRLSEGSAGISVLELEKRMAFPREYLNFTLWYLRAKKYITLEENSDYALTFEGVDFVEANSVGNHAIRQLLTAGNGDENAVSVESSSCQAAPAVIRKRRRHRRGQRSGGAAPRSFQSTRTA